MNAFGHTNITSLLTISHLVDTYVIAPIIMQIAEDFWVALITFFVASIAVSLLFGLWSKTEWRNETGRYSITCHKCDYGCMEILSSDENGVYARCKRCGDTRGYNY